MDEVKGGSNWPPMLGRMKVPRPAIMDEHARPSAPGAYAELVEVLRAISRDLTTLRDPEYYVHERSNITFPEIKDYCDRAAAAITALVAERDRLREALEPFARVAGHYNTFPWPETGYIGVYLNFHSPEITVGDLRRARAALATEKERG